MKSFQVAIVIGALVALIGIGLLYPTRPSQDNYNDFIGPDEFYYVEMDIFFGGRVSGNYTDSGGRSLILHVYDTQQFLTFTTQSTPQGLFSTSGSSRFFSADLSMPGKYYVVIEHGLGDEQTTQTFTMNVRIDGTNSLMLGLGVGMTAVGGIVAIVGYRAKKRSESQKQSSPQDVVLFGQPPPPPQSSPPQQ
jgi:hypothetical protein